MHDTPSVRAQGPHNEHPRCSSCRSHAREGTGWQWRYCGSGRSRQAALTASARTIWRGRVHEAHTMSTQGAYYMGLMRWGMWGSGGRSGPGGRGKTVMATLAVSAHKRQSCGTYKTHIMSTWCARYVGPVVWKNRVAMQVTCLVG
jgi:hypothetical protein